MSIKVDELVRRASIIGADLLGPKAAETDRTEEYPGYAVEALRSAGLLGLTIPEEYGGHGGSLADAIAVIVEVAKHCAASGRIVVETNMGAIGAIMRYGTEEQKRRAASLVLDDGDKPAICITEPEAGSAATWMSTEAQDGGDHYLINGKKHWITGAGVSRLHLVLARVVVNGQSTGIGGFVMEREGLEGFSIGRREPAMGIRGIPESEVILENVRVPKDALLQVPGGPGRSFAQLMSAYNAQRLGAAAVAWGIANGAYEKAVRFAQTRQQFGRPICEFQGLQWMFADMDIALTAGRALLAQAADIEPGKFPDMRKVAQAKIFAGEMAVKVTNDALQMFGSAGYSRRNPLERMVRDARMFTISGGTAQVLRNQIATKIFDRKFSQ